MSFILVCKTARWCHLSVVHMNQTEKCATKRVEIALKLPSKAVVIAHWMASVRDWPNNGKGVMFT